MITGENLDRRFWIGASDTLMVMSNHSSKTFKEWWGKKTGFIEQTGNSFSNIYTMAGDMYEKPIAYAFGEDITEDRTLTIPDYSLRVNLDADTPKKIIECKTYKWDKGKMDPRSQTYKRYYMQVQVQQFAWELTFGKPIEAELRIYYLTDEDYDAVRQGRILDLDSNRLERREIAYNKPWIENDYLPKLIPLATILKNHREKNASQGE